MRALRGYPNYRAIWRVGDRYALEHWEIQESHRGLFGHSAWRLVLVVATKAEAQAKIDELSNNGIIYPTGLVGATPVVERAASSQVPPRPFKPFPP